MSSSSSNSSDHVTSCSNDTSRAAHDDGQRPRGTGAPPVPDSASALAGLPLLKPKMSQIVRYIGNHGGDLWSETRCVTHGMLREELHTIPNYPLEKTVEKKVKTSCIVLSLCLNIGVDPPDVSKPFKCANLESWVNPDKVPSSQNVCEVIARELEHNYRQIFPRISIQKSLDPCSEDLCEIFQKCRNNHKSDRILIHYNGHGVPSPSDNGEIWVFNRDYTQYIPLSLQDAQANLGKPVMWIFDCNRAGLAMKWYKSFLTQQGCFMAPGDVFLLGACGVDEFIPLNPEYPADVFTACLTTPLRMAALWHCKHSLAAAPLDPELAEMIPGELSKRNTPLGELAWIYTTITDTIAYDILPRDQFQRLLRHDLTVATLFRNFLLAQRIMRSLGCTAVSVPNVPENYQHPLWKVFDAALESTLTQVAAARAYQLRLQQRQLMLQQSQNQRSRDLQGRQNLQMGQQGQQSQQQQVQKQQAQALGFPMREYVPSEFFTEQLQAFEVWLSFGAENSKPPEQLPTVLQVILNQRHRTRALKLLSRFVDLGPEEVVQTMHVGTLPYLVKLLVSNSDEIREHLTLIWTKILAFDKRYQIDILRERGNRFFLDTLSDQMNSEVSRTMAAYALSALMDESPSGQQMCSEDHFISCTLGLLNQYARYQQQQQSQQQFQQIYPFLPAQFYWWVVLALGKIWENNDVTKYKAIRSNVHKYIPPFLEHQSPEVRAATLYAYGTFFSDVANDYKPEVQRLIKDDEVFFATNAGLGANDGSPLVRKEYVYALSRFISGNIREMAHVIFELEQQLLPTLLSSSSSQDIMYTDDGENDCTPIVPDVTSLHNRGSIVMGLKGFGRQCQKPLQEDSGYSFYAYIWKTLLLLADDPQEIVAECATDLIQRVRRFVASHIQDGILVLPQQNNGDSMSESPKIALKSTFYEWSCEYWKTPLIGRDFEDTTSLAYKEREKRHRAYNAMYMSTRDSWADWEQGTRRDIALMASLPSSSSSGSSKDGVSCKMIFHPYESVLVSGTSGGNIVVWDWEEQKRVKSFPCRSRFSTKVTSLLMANEYDDTHLVVASDDGTVKVWKDFADPYVPSKMVTSWVAIADNRQLDYENKGGSDVVMEWFGNDKIITCGASREIGLFDVRGEAYITSYVTKTSSNITSIITDNQLFIAGCEDGTIRFFDPRITPRDSLVRVLHYPSPQDAEGNPIVNVARISPKEMVSASLNGNICYWDLEGTDGKPFKILNDENGISSFVVHSKASVLAYGSVHSPKISVCTRNGNLCKKIKSHDGFISQRIAPISNLVFHPHNIMFASGFSDSLVCIYSLK